MKRPRKHLLTHSFPMKPILQIYGQHVPGPISSWLNLKDKMLASLSVAFYVTGAGRSDNKLDRTSIYILECSLSLLTKLEALSLKCVRFFVQKIYVSAW